MSRWLPERLTLHVAAADSLAALDVGERLRQRALELAVAGFEAQLDALKPARHARVSCVFAGELVRYAIVPWNPGARGQARRQAFAQHCFKETYGDVASTWAVSQDAPRYGQATLACAVDSGLLDRLAAMLRGRGLVPSQLQPSLMQAVNAARRATRAATFWVVVQEPRAMTLLLIVDRQPVLVKVLTCREHDLGVVLAREWLALGLETARCPVVLASPDMPVPHQLAGWTLRVLGGQGSKAATRQGIGPEHALRTV